MMSVDITPTGLVSMLMLLGLLILYLFLLPYLQSPLKNIPNAHWSSSVSPLWILWTRYQNQELAVLEEKHRQLGSIVRLGPADLSINCYENGVRTIYNGGFEKPEYYNFFSYYAKTNAFCSLTRHDHSMRRKRITPAYTKSAVFNSKPLSSLTQTILFERLLPLLQNQAVSKEQTDILPLAYALSLDLLTCFQFGLSSGSNFLQTPFSITSWLRSYEQRYCKQAFWPQELPILTRCLKWCGIDMLPQSQHHATQFLENWLLELCDRAEFVRLASEQEGLREAGDTPVVYELVKRGVDNDMPNASPETKRTEVASELFDHMSGGREVLGLVLAYTIYYISQNPSSQVRLRAELAALKPSMHEADFTLSNGTQHHQGTGESRLPPPSSLDELPYLSAVLKESFRMRPTSTPLPRITPRDRTVSLAGVDGIPPGTRVNVFQWFIHRNPENHNQANEWCPERWLEPELKDGKSPLLWAFGGGSRICVGVSLTQYLMRYILAIVYANFSTRLVSKKDGVHEPGSMEDEIIIQFERVAP